MIRALAGMYAGAFGMFVALAYRYEIRVTDPSPLFTLWAIAASALAVASVFVAFGRND